MVTKKTTKKAAEPKKAVKEVKAKAPAKKKTAEAKDPSSVVKGNHLTVITHSDGRTELQWDDEALLQEVRAAIASAELSNMKPAVKAKVAVRQKKAKV